jgi:hypothetical protein
MQLFNTMNFQVAALVVTATYIASALYFFDQIKKRKASRREKFYKSLTEYFKLGLIKTLEDVINIDRGIHSPTNEDGYQQGLSRWLQGYLVYIAANQDKLNNDIELIKNCKEVISQFIKENNRTSPFAELPDSERGVLSDISDFLKADDKEAVFRKLTELSVNIKSKNEVFNQLKSQNKWSIPLAIIGVVLTIIFGTISFIK